MRLLKSTYLWEMKETLGEAKVLLSMKEEEKTVSGATSMRPLLWMTSQVSGDH